MLKFWNKKINLVSRKSIETSWERHFLDSAQLWLHLPYKARKWLDFWFRSGFSSSCFSCYFKRTSARVKIYTGRKKQKKKAGFLLEIVKKIGLNVDIFPKMLN